MSDGADEERDPAEERWQLRRDLAAVRAELANLKSRRSPVAKDGAVWNNARELKDALRDVRNMRRDMKAFSERLDALESDASETDAITTGADAPVFYRRH